MRMLINVQPDQLRVAVTAGPRLVDLDVEVPGQEQTVSNIYKGVITSIEASLGAVFVNFGGERHGFLPLKEISNEYFQGQIHNPNDEDIKNLLRPGQELVVQIEKEQRGTKGAALTTFISLAGSYMVLMPNNPRAGGISRRIEGDERDQLRSVLSELSIPEGMGVIIRTAGLGKTKEELQWDLNFLLRYWEAIKQAAVAKRGPHPYLIHQESDAVIRAIRDYIRQDMDEIIIDENNAFQRAKNYLGQIRPDFVERLKLYQDQVPLFGRFQIEQQIESAYNREVRLPSGGSIVIDHSEALVAIDINSSRATKGGNIEETALNTNLEAADEIARQLRIRDIGGLIVIDFIDMTPVRNQREVENRLRDALHQDRARIQVGRISRFGLLEMSRQRLRTSLIKSSHIPCPRCEAQGTIRTVESQALSIIHLVEEQASRAENILFQVQLPIDVATYVINEKREMLKSIEKHCNVKIVVIPNEYIESPQYQIKQIKCDLKSIEAGEGIPTYRLVKAIRLEAAAKKPIMKSAVEPIINQFLVSETDSTLTPRSTPVSSSTTNTGASGSNSSNGLIKRLWQKMFGNEDAEKNENNEKAAAESGRRQYNRPGQKRYSQNYRQGASHRSPNQNRNRTRRGTRGGTRRAPTPTGGSTSSNNDPSK